MTAHEIQRRTLTRPITIEGLGLFTDAPASSTLTPAAAGSDICFRHKGTLVPAKIANLAPSPIPAFATLPARHTCLAQGPARVTTCEHILSALTGLGITDVTIELGDSGELPIGDGSAKPFTDAIASDDTHTLDDQVTPITVRKPVTVRSGSATITAEPADSASYTYHFEPPEGSPLKAQAATWNGNADDYLANVAPARTFSTLAEATQAKALGLFTCFTPRELLVLDDITGTPIDNRFRFDNEPARHKLLDLIGDLALVGRPIWARITATRSGHALNHELARRIVEMID